MSFVRMVRRNRFRLAMVFFALAAVLLTAGIAAACPTCKDGMAANDPEHAHMVKGYFYSILFMMGMPYLLLTSFGLYMYREVRKAAPAMRRNQQPKRRRRNHSPPPWPPRRSAKFKSASWSKYRGRNFGGELLTAGPARRHSGANSRIAAGRNTNPAPAKLPARHRRTRSGKSRQNAVSKHKVCCRRQQI